MEVRRVDGLEAVVRAPRFVALRLAIAPWRVVLAFVPLCCIWTFVEPRGLCCPDRGMLPPGPYLTRVPYLYE